MIGPNNSCGLSGRGAERDASGCKPNVCAYIVD